MIITLIRTGGFTGIPLKKTIDTQKLPRKDAKKIHDLIANADFSSFKQPLASDPPLRQGFEGQADRFTYSIEIQKNSVISHNIKLTENSLTEPLKKLINYLETF